MIVRDRLGLKPPSHTEVFRMSNLWSVVSLTMSTTPRSLPAVKVHNILIRQGFGGGVVLYVRKILMFAAETFGGP